MIEQNINLVKSNLLSVPQKVTLLCATKTIEPGVINSLSPYGITEIGENRVQEFLSKYDAVKGFHWHFIGRLQTNKVKSVVGKVVLIHSVDRLNLAKTIDSESAKLKLITDILLEVNIGGEENKGGVLTEGLDELYRQVSAMKNLRIRGFMTVMPKDADKDLYIQMKKLFDHYRRQPYFDTLSMGMSSDYRIAAECGATMIRLGSAIFGPRAAVTKE